LAISKPLPKNQVNPKIMQIKIQDKILKIKKLEFENSLKIKNSKIKN